MCLGESFRCCKYRECDILGWLDWCSQDEKPVPGGLVHHWRSLHSAVVVLGLGYRAPVRAAGTHFQSLALNRSAPKQTNGSDLQADRSHSPALKGLWQPVAEKSQCLHW